MIIEPHRSGLSRVLGHLGEIADSLGTPFYAYDWLTLHQTAETLIADAERADLRNQLRLYPALFALPNFSIFRRLMALDPRLGITCNTAEEIVALQGVGFSDWNRVVFSGGVLKKAELLKLAETGVLVNAASVGNLEKLAAIPSLSRIGLRLDLYNSALKGIREPEIVDCLGLLKKAGRRVEALHSYRGTQISSVQALARHAELLLDIARNMDDVREVNFGGGFHYDYDDPTGRASSRVNLFEYFRAVREVATSGDKKFHGLLAWEPGRILFAGSGFFVAEIVEVRKTGLATADYYLDASFAQMPSAKLIGRQHHALIVSNAGEIRRGSTREVRLCGTTTLSTDRLLPDTSFLATACEGDRLIVFDVGAYGRAGSYSFLGKALPPEVLVTEGNWKTIRPRGQSDYLSDGRENGRSGPATSAVSGS